MLFIWTYYYYNYLTQYLFNINVYRYAQSNRKNQNIKPLAKEIHEIGELFTTKVYKFLQLASTFWIQKLENLHYKTISQNYGQIGDNPFSQLNITKNYTE